MLYPSKEFLELFKKTPGAISVCEAICIMNIADSAPNGGLALELGTHKGKSALSASQGLSEVSRFYLVDPIFDNTEVGMDVVKLIRGDKETGKINNPHYNTPVIIDGYSVGYLSTHHLRKDMYSYVFVDSGSHQDGLPIQEVKLLEDRIVPNGIIAFHDFDSQFKEVREAYDYLISTGKYEPISINWNEIIDYVRENNLEEGNNTWHHTEMQFPCFVGAVRKIR